jgi:hypothetical protein
MKLRKFEKISLLTSKDITEKWIQERIAEDPSILGLGDLVLRDKERTQPSAGRLDLLLQDAETNRRYEVELQLGKVDESHIIRTIEYWDIERKRYPQYDHCAVIISEEITGRFLNVISLFNGNIPLIAVKMDAYKISEDEISLSFNTVLDEMTLGLTDEDEEISEATDRDYWIRRGTEQTVGMADTLLGFIGEFTEEKIELKYNKFYIGLAKEGLPSNFAIFRPRKNSINVEIKLPYSEDIQADIDSGGLDDMGYLKRWGLYRLRLTDKDLKNKKELISKLLQYAYKNFRS